MGMLLLLLLLLRGGGTMWWGSCCCRNLRHDGGRLLVIGEVGVGVGWMRLCASSRRRRCRSGCRWVGGGVVCLVLLGWVVGARRSCWSRSWLRVGWKGGGEWWIWPLW